MEPIPDVAVTLSDELLDHLRRLVADLGVPLEWLVAGLVCDTLESAARGPGRRHIDP